MSHQPQNSIKSMEHVLPIFEYYFIISEKLPSLKLGLDRKPDGWAETPGTTLMWLIFKLNLRPIKAPTYLYEDFTHVVTLSIEKSLQSLSLIYLLLSNFEVAGNKQLLKTSVIHWKTAVSQSNQPNPLIYRLKMKSCHRDRTLSFPKLFYRAIEFKSNCVFDLWLFWKNPNSPLSVSHCIYI